MHEQGWLHQLPTLALAEDLAQALLHFFAKSPFNDFARKARIYSLSLHHIFFETHSAARRVVLEFEISFGEE